MSSHHDSESEPEEVPSDHETTLPPPALMPESPRPRRHIIIRETSPEDCLLGQEPIFYRKKEDGILKCKTAKKTSRLPEKRKLADRCAKDIEEPSHAPSKMKKLDFYVLGMSMTLKKWRGEDRIPSTYEVDETSATPPSLLTIEDPLELTIPTLVDRIALHDHQLESAHDVTRETWAELRALQEGVIHRLTEEMNGKLERLDLVEDVVGDMRRETSRGLENVRDELLGKINVEAGELDEREISVEEIVRALREDWTIVRSGLGDSVDAFSDDVETMRRVTLEELRIMGAGLRSTQRTMDSLSGHVDLDCHALSGVSDTVDDLERRVASVVMLSVASAAVAGLAVLFGLISHFTR